MGWGRYLFGFKGRINRAKFWLYIPLALALAAVIVAGFTIGHIYHSPLDPLTIHLAATVVANIVFVAISVKRLHDRDKSGWWMLVLYVLPVLLPNIGEQSGNSDIHLACQVATLLLVIWAIIELGCLRGTKGANRFGPDPLGDTQVASMQSAG